MIIRIVFFLLYACSHLSALEPIFVVFGPPGTGKGTFSQYIHEQYGYSHLSVGDVVREEISLQTEIGKQADECLRKGDFLEEAMIQALVSKHLIPFLQNKTPVIIDGFPRTEESVYFIHNLFQQYNLSGQVLLIGLYADDATCEKRILSRSICGKCARIYNDYSCPPKQANICDSCFAQLKIRSNDNEAIARKRLEEFHLVTEKAYRLAQTIFPSIEFSTSGSLEECLQNYTRFMTHDRP
ncbi:putative adenylate kinase [Candidatus Protochlamydia naegleriophila]|uniref:Adenylate kinase n=1 Tax=Candidatus Protochlamydia naegleriophila TaxID=389348 RepID=A0A0U5JBC9_9BACT|nr:nucleoside monophosphate kinase [Candidatus Protochlamydia naegleriophila]CUI17160.1 putative adenylate kinase [Candidatus Protochlamydia naegleriophila]